MPDATITTNFFLVLALLANAAVACTALLALASAFSSSARRSWRAGAAFLGPQSLLAAWTSGMEAVGSNGITIGGTVPGGR